MKKALIILLLFFTIPVYAKIADSKNFHISADNLFMISLCTLNSLNYKIVEMQSESGYILFKTPAQNEYLMTITKTGSTTSNVKILKLEKSAPFNEIKDAIYIELEKQSPNIPIEVK